jgi:hypothetical protein
VHTFDDKISAILYTIYTVKQKHWAADEIIALDSEINKCYADVQTLRHGLESARKRGDYFTVDTRQSRLELAETRLSVAKNKISKIHKTGKYYKVWE